MACEFKAVDRDQPMLLPPDLWDWLPEDHLARLVLEVVEQLDLTAIEASFARGGVGREAFDPRLLIGLLIYGYCQGVRSARQIERACVTDVAFRVIAAQQRPDHTTLARFRARHAAALADLFGQVLSICGRAGLGRVGIVAIDGTKIAGQASPHKNCTEKTLRKLAAGIIEDAAAIDDAEDAEFGPDRSGGELPEDLRPGPERAARIRQALAQVEAERAAAAAEDTAVADRKVARARRAAARERGYQLRRREGKRPRADRMRVDEQVKVRRADARVAVTEQELAQAKVGQGRRAQTANPVANISDPDSHLMFVRGKGYLQGYNAQVAVSDDHLIVATGVSTDTNDMLLFPGMLDQTVATVAAHLDGAEIGIVLADAGYCTHEALTCPGPDRLIATGRKPDQPAQTGKDPAIAAMARRLADNGPDRVTYRRRQATVEPVIGQLKDRLGLRRFARRGKQAAEHELAFAAMVYNIRRLATS
jgi:transposase